MKRDVMARVGEQLARNISARDHMLALYPCDVHYLLRCAEAWAALEDGRVRVIEWSDDRTRFGVFVDLPTGGEDEIVADTPLDAVLAALDAARTGVSE